MLCGKAHEDFGLTPIILLTAKSIYSIDEPLYYYVKRENSITTTNNTEKIAQNVYDTLYHFDNLYSFIKSANIAPTNQAIILSHLANGLISKINVLSSKNREKYIKELKQRNIIDMLLNNTIKRKIKKLLIQAKFIFL